MDRPVGGGYVYPPTCVFRDGLGDLERISGDHRGLGLLEEMTNGWVNSWGRCGG